MIKKTVSSLLVLMLLCGCVGPFKDKFPRTNYPEGVPIISRKDWDWKKINGELPVPQEILKVTIMHSGEPFDERQDAPVFLKVHQKQSRKEKKWIDVPYHFYIDLKGTIYEGRPIAFVAEGDSAFQAAGHATVCVLGNYDTQEVRQEPLQALIKLSAYLAETYNLSLRDITGGRDHYETTSPGDNIYQYIEDGSILYEVSRLLKK